MLFFIYYIFTACIRKLFICFSNRLFANLCDLHNFLPFLQKQSETMNKTPNRHTPFQQKIYYNNHAIVETTTIPRLPVPNHQHKQEETE